MLQNIYKEQNRLILWIPIFFMCGILCYFSYTDEPSKTFIFLPTIISILIYVVFLKNPLLKMISLFIAFFFLGQLNAYLKTHLLSTKFLTIKLDDFSFKGIVEEQEFSPLSNTYKLVVLLDKEVNTIQKIKLTFKNNPHMLPEIGDTIVGKATLLPFSDPASLNSYDFRRNAYFQGIGASGKIKELRIEQKENRSGIKKTRCNVTDYIRSKMEGQAAEVAIAVTTGFRNGLSNEIRQDFANSGLSHILAISGLHISLVAGLIFLIFRRFLSIIIPISQRYNTKKIACLISIPAIFYYVALSGYGYPAIRAFCMTSLLFLAVLLDRFPLNIRSIAIAAFIILLIFPESGTSVSFQLSFAAVLGLIAFYEKPWWSLKLWSLKKNKWAKYFVYILGVSTTTLIATLATTPISLYYFNQWTLNAVFANMVAIPLTGVFIMPLATICVISSFICDLSYIFKLWEISLNFLIFIAQTVSHWPGSHLKIAQPSTLYITLFGIGFLWLCIFTTRLRFFGLIFITAAFLTFFDKSHLPDIYLSKKSIAYKKDNFFYVLNNDHEKDAFTLNQWKQEQGFKDFSSSENPIILNSIMLLLNPWTKEKDFLKGIICPKILVTNGYLKKCKKESDKVIDKFRIKEHGTHFIWLEPFKLKTMKEHLGNRPWAIP